jgi:hypothetical protein
MQPQVLTIAEIKAQYPNQWVLVGNPVMDAQEQQVIAGLPVFYSKSKKEVCYLGAELVKKFDSTILLFTGQPKHPQRIVATIFNRNPFDHFLNKKTRFTNTQKSIARNIELCFLLYCNAKKITNVPNN